MLQCKSGIEGEESPWRQNFVRGLRYFDKGRDMHAISKLGGVNRSKEDPEGFVTFMTFVIKNQP